MTPSYAQGYNVPNGYMGLVKNEDGTVEYMQFASEEDYLEYVQDEDE